MKQSSALPFARVTLRFLIGMNRLYGVLIFALLASSFVNEGWTWRALDVDSVAGRGSVVTGMRAIMLIGVVAVPITGFVLWELLRIVESVRVRAPFTNENAGRLRTIAWALLGLQLLHVCVVLIAYALSEAGVQFRYDDIYDVSGWLGILLLFVLAQVFLEGTRMREDLEGTV